MDGKNGPFNIITDGNADIALFVQLTQLHNGLLHGVSDEETGILDKIMDYTGDFGVNICCLCVCVRVYIFSSSLCVCTGTSAVPNPVCTFCGLVLYWPCPDCTAADASHEWFESLAADKLTG